jgi:hypothetical protein
MSKNGQYAYENLKMNTLFDRDIRVSGERGKRCIVDDCELPEI